MAICSKCDGKGEVKMRIGSWQKCPFCDGTGRKPENSSTRCPYCGIPMKLHGGKYRNYYECSECGHWRPE